MSDAKVVAVMQRQAAEAEVERLRLVGEIEDMRERAEKAEAQLASITGVTRLELVAAERAKRDGLLAAAAATVRELESEDCGWCGAKNHDCRCVDGKWYRNLRAAIAAAEAAP